MSKVTNEAARAILNQIADKQPEITLEDGASVVTEAVAIEAMVKFASSYMQPETVGDGPLSMSMFLNRADYEEALTLRTQKEALEKRVGPPYHFDRYINGMLMAEGITIEREQTFEAACKAAARLASKGPNGETPVLVALEEKP